MYFSIGEAMRAKYLIREGRIVVCISCPGWTKKPVCWPIYLRRLEDWWDFRSCLNDGKDHLTAWRKSIPGRIYCFGKSSEVGVRWACREPETGVPSHMRCNHKVMNVTSFDTNIPVLYIPAVLSSSKQTSWESRFLMKTNIPLNILFWSRLQSQKCKLHPFL